MRKDPVRRREYYRELRQRRNEMGGCARCKRTLEDKNLKNCARCRKITSLTSLISKWRRMGDTEKVNQYREQLDCIYILERMEE